MQKREFDTTLNSQNLFSKSITYKIVISGATLPHCLQWLSCNSFKLKERNSGVDIYQIKKQFKDQVHLVSFIKELFDYHFTIICIRKQ